MSRVGKKVITIPKEVTVTLLNIENGQKIIIKGKHGSLERIVSKNVNIIVENNLILIQRTSETKVVRSYHGLIRALVQNMVTGVDQKFSKVLIAEGVGYKFQVDKTSLIANVGFTHPVSFSIPDEIAVKSEGATKILITGIDKEKVGFLAAQIRSIRPPEPYKGKGILYEGEKVIRKAGKTGK
jgi:large subunit ribosomal protein L6